MYGNDFLPGFFLPERQSLLQVSYVFNKKCPRKNKRAIQNPLFIIRQNRYIDLLRAKENTGPVRFSSLSVHRKCPYGRGEKTAGCCRNG
jgi:hypothetical protein